MKVQLRLGIGLVLFLQALTAWPGWFGPSNFDECILGNMKGVTSDLAAKSVARACRDKFPAQEPRIVELPDSILKEIKSKGASIFSDGYFRANFGNGTNNYTITSIKVRLYNKDTASHRDYTVNFETAYDLNKDGEIDLDSLPYKEQFDALFPSVSLYQFLSPNNWTGGRFRLFEEPKNWSWHIVSGTGYEN